jgi:uncharacterized protein
MFNTIYEDYDMKLTEEKVKDFVKKSIRKSNRPNYPFRSRYRHTKRVLMWAKRLQKELGGDLEVLTYSALLHDCDWNGNENHAITSYKTAKKFLNKFDVSEEFKKQVLEGIKYHNDRTKKGLSKESYILMDADELDELGAVTIMWNALAEQHEKKNVTYRTVLDRTKRFLPELESNMKYLHFDYSKEIYQRKIDFQKAFIKEAEEELIDD